MVPDPYLGFSLFYGAFNADIEELDLSRRASLEKSRSYVLPSSTV